jgi:pyruvate kinase
MRKTKIIATLGPATASYGKIAALIKAGVNVFRLNFSHGDFSFFSKLIASIKKVRLKLGVSVAIMQDLQGPKIRVSGLKVPISVKRGEALKIKSQNLKVKSEANSISVDFKDLYKHVKPGQKILINDGMVQLRVEKIKGKEIICKVTAGGEIAPRKGVNLPHAKLPVASLTIKDRKNLKFGMNKGIDIVCLSFVRDANDMKVLNSFIKIKNRPLVIAKIEKPEALKQIGAILDESDGVMVARGDLAVEAGYRSIPGAQKMIIQKANAKGKIVIVATQMLESMINNPYPERAEITDVYNAVLDGTDAVMLSGETSVGKYPEKTVRVMSGIIKEAEKNPAGKGCGVSCVTKGHEFENALSLAASITSEKLWNSVIAVNVEEPHDIQYISDHRPKRPVIAVSKDEGMYRKLAMYHGANPVLAKGGTVQVISRIRRQFKGTKAIVYLDFHGRGKTKGGIQVY